MDDLEKGKMELAEDQTLKLVVVKDGRILYKSNKTGIRPLYDLSMEKDIDLRGASLLDRVIGKGAALLAINLGVDQVYGDLMSELAMKSFEKAGINYYYQERTSFIENRKRDDLCPVEKISKNLDSGKELLIELKSFFNK